MFCLFYWWNRLWKVFSNAISADNNKQRLLLLDYIYAIIYFVCQNQIQCKRQPINGLNAACFKWLQGMNTKTNKNHQSRKFLCVFLFLCDREQQYVHMFLDYIGQASSELLVVIPTFVSMVGNRNFISNNFCRSTKLIFSGVFFFDSNNKFCKSINKL